MDILNIEELINKAASAGASAAIKKYKEDERKTSKKRAFQKTDLLLRKLDVLMEHCNNAIYTPNEIEIEIESIRYSEIDDDDLYIKSILRTKTRTLMMMNLVNKSICSLKRELSNKEKYYKYQAIELVYFKNKTFEEAAIELSCDVSTIRRWKNDVIRELSGYIYGIDGLELD